MAWTQDDLDKIDAALASGAAIKRLKFRDQEFEFRDIDEMMKVRDLIARSLAAAIAPTNYRLASTSKGV